MEKKKHWFREQDRKTWPQEMTDVPSCSESLHCSGIIINVQTKSRAKKFLLSPLESGQKVSLAQAVSVAILQDS